MAYATPEDQAGRNRNVWQHPPPPEPRMGTIGVEPDEVPRPIRPRSIDLAVNLMYVGAGLTVLTLVVTLAMRGAMRDAILESNPGLHKSTVDGRLNEAMVRELFWSVIGVCLWVWMAFKNGDGRRWARVVATVLGVLNLLVTALGFVVLPLDIWIEILPVLGLLAIGGVVLAVTILVLLYQAPSTQFISGMTRWNAAMVLRGFSLGTGRR